MVAGAASACSTTSERRPARAARVARSAYDADVERGDTSSGTAERAWIVQLGTLALIWGSSFLLIKVALRSFEPLQVSGGRIVLGALTLCAMLLVTRTPLPRGDRIWLHLGVVGLLTNAIPFSLFAWGETRLGSIEAGIWNATTPLVAAVAVMLMLHGERPTRVGVLGLLVGFGGVLVVLAPWRGLGHGELLGHAAFAGAAACYGVAAPYMRRHLASRPDSGVALSAGQLLCASAVMVVANVVTHPPAPHDVAWLPVLAVVGLGAFGTGIAYVMFTAVIRAAGANVAASVTYLMPLVSTTLGVAVLHERLGWYEPVGGAIVLIGVALSSTRVARRRVVDVA
jgi:drug/metabolite transporter (DMT)-like permease